MEPPFPAVATGDPVREAVELLAGERPGAARHRGRPPGRASSPAPTCWSRWSAGDASAASPPAPSTPASSPTRPTASSSRRSTRPRPTCSRRPGEFVEDYDYSRSANPTRAALERALGELEGGHGDRVLQRHGGRARADHRGLPAPATTSSSPTTSTAAPTGSSTRCSAAGGSTYTMVDQRDLDALSARGPAPRRELIWVETPTNPTLNVVDIAGVVDAQREGALVAVDNTFATPVYQRPLELGADAVVHSTTKYLGGHSDAVGGAVIVRDPALHEQRALRAELGRRGARAARLLPRAPRAAHAAPADGGAHARTARAVSEFLRGVDGRERRALARASAAWSRSAIPTRAGSPRRTRCSRWPSRSAAWSR